MAVLNIENQSEFTDKVLETSQPVLVDFWAPWCPPCKMLGPEIEAVAEAYAGKAVVAKVNTEAQPQIAKQFQVMTIPTIIIIKDGQEINRIIGYNSRQKLMEFLDAVM